MTRRGASPRRGFSLAELMVALVIAGVIGVALTRLLISQSRFVARQDGYMRARAASRAGLSVLSEEMRQVGDLGVVAASPDSVTLRVPFAYGIACAQTFGSTVAALLPPDSARLASATIAGYAWRDTNFVWHVVEPATSSSYATGMCTSSVPATAVLPSPTGATYAVALTPNVVATTDGSPLYLYQLIRYSFEPSLEIPGNLGLYREAIGSGMKEELVAPFDTITTGFSFLVGSMRRVQSAVPSSLDSIVGLQVLFGGISEVVPYGMNLPPRFALRADLVFRNHGL